MIMFLLIGGKHSLENVVVGGVWGACVWRAVVRKCCCGTGLRGVSGCRAESGEFLDSGVTPWVSNCRGRVFLGGGLGCRCSLAYASVCCASRGEVYFVNLRALASRLRASTRQLLILLLRLLVRPVCRRRCGRFGSSP